MYFCCCQWLQTKLAKRYHHFSVRSGGMYTMHLHARENEELKGDG